MKVINATFFCATVFVGNAIAGINCEVVPKLTKSVINTHKEGVSWNEFREIAMKANNKNVTDFTLVIGSMVYTNNVSPDFPESMRVRCLDTYGSMAAQAKQQQAATEQRPQPSVQQPSVQQPSVQQLSVQQPSVQQLSAQQPSVQPPSVQQSSESPGIGEFFGVVLEVISAIATPLAKGYVDQGNENARNASGRRSAPDYICTPAGGGSATCTSY